MAYFGLSGKARELPVYWLPRYCRRGRRGLPGLADGTERRHLRHGSASPPQVPSRGDVRTAQEPGLVSVTKNSTRATASPGWFSSDSPSRKHSKNSGANVKSREDRPVKAPFGATACQETSPHCLPSRAPGQPGPAATLDSSGGRPANMWFCSIQPGPRDPIKHREGYSQVAQASQSDSSQSDVIRVRK